MSTKKCIRCEKVKSASEFYAASKMKDRLHSYCKECHKQWNTEKYEKDKDKVLAANKRWADANPEKIRDIALRYSYNITLADYDSMLKAQRGVCKICGAEPKNKPLNVDHCHKTGNVRGLLCISCNTMLGKIECNPSLVDNMKKYLDSTGNEYY